MDDYSVEMMDSARVDRSDCRSDQLSVVRTAVWKAAYLAFAKGFEKGGMMDSKLVVAMALTLVEQMDNMKADYLVE